MDLRVAQCARLELSGLIVERRSPRCRAEARRGMALQTEQVYGAKPQHVLVRAAVRYVA